MPLNPRAVRGYVDEYPNKHINDQVHDYPHFFMGVDLLVFRHIRDLKLEFRHPISVISGSNRSGKTTALMAVACSHYNFTRPNVNNGTPERATWSKVVRFTSQDVQGELWTYHVHFRTGLQIRTNTGSKNAASSKWSGVAKKSGQIGRPTPGHMGGGRTVILIDLNRINPSRHLSPTYYGRVRRLPGIPFPEQARVNEYLSYILEDNYVVEQIAPAADTKIFKFTTTSHYSSYNTASGEDVLVSMLCQILAAPENSLVLIDEIEVGLHPKVQRRLMDVLYFISKAEHKQFIITSHAYAIIDSVPAASRLFIERRNNISRCLSGLTTYETLTRMDCEAFPVATVYVEDRTSQLILEYAIKELNVENPGFSRLVNTVIIGAADATFNYFSTRKSTREKEPNTSLPACVLDGDMSTARDRNGELKYPAQPALFFHYTTLPPEKMLLREYLAVSPNEMLQYHYNSSDPHCLLSKMVEAGIAQNIEGAFDYCFKAYHDSVDGGAHFEELKSFLKELCQ